MALKYLDLVGLQSFWNEAKVYIDNADTSLGEKLYGTTIPASDALTLTSLKTLIDDISGGDLSVPVATGAKVGGILSGGDITVAGNGSVTVNQAAKLKTAQSITLTGAVTGSATFDGSAAASINASIGTILQSALDLKAPLAAPALTGNVTIDGKTAATQEYVNTQIAAHVTEVTGAMIYKGAAANAEALPDSAKPGWTYKASAAFSLGDVEVKLGDLIVCSANSGSDPTWDVYPIDEEGEVFGPTSAADGNLVAFDGATGKLVKDSTITTTSVSSAISALAGISGTVKNYVDTAVSGATLTAGTVTETGTNAISISGKAINITLKAYALASDLDALEALVGSTPVSDQIDAKITAGINGGVIQTWADGRYPSVAITEEEIDAIFSTSPGV